MTQELLADLRSRINPVYENVRGTESHERKQCADAIEALMGRLEKAEKELSFLNGDLLYWTERAVGKGSANSDIGEAWERYEAFQRAAMEASK